MVSLGFYLAKVGFYIKNTNFGPKGPEFELYPFEPALNENICKINVPFSSANNLDSNDKWFSRDLT